MTARSGKSPGAGKKYFLSLENLSDGDTIALPDVLSRLVFNDQGLIPVVTQDNATGEVLMFAWMDQAALERTVATGQMTYFSRSRGELWIKGETSGSFQWVEDMRFDCDGDVLLCRVRQEGSACHTQRRSCFYLKVESQDNSVVIDSAPWLPSMVREESGER